VKETERKREREIKSDCERERERERERESKSKSKGFKARVPKIDFFFQEMFYASLCLATDLRAMFLYILRAANSLLVAWRCGASAS
jgi:hypothetical protein